MSKRPDNRIIFEFNICRKWRKQKHGVEIGSEYYFNKTAKDLSIAQCAF